MNLQPAKTEFTADEHAEIRRKVETIKANEGLSQAEICRQAELPDSNLSRYLKDAYTGDNDPIAAKLHRWLLGRERAAALRLRLPVAPSFQPLHTSTRLLALLDMAREMGRIVTVTGEPGTSKTATARQYCARENTRAWLATMDPSTAGVPTMLLEVLKAMGEPETKGTPQVLARRVVDKAVEAKGLIIIDEVQHLSDKALEQIRSINDATRHRGQPVGIALIGNEMKNRLAGNGTRAEFAQVSSRVAQRRIIKQPDPRDVADLAQAWAEANKEVLGKAELDFVQRIAARPGGLRNVEMTFEGALLVSLAEQEPLTVEHLRGAFSQLAGLANAA